MEMGTVSRIEQDFRQFHNRLRILRSIDKHEFDSALAHCELLPSNEAAWQSFQKDPFHWLVAARDEWARAVFSIVREREA